MKNVGFVDSWDNWWFSPNWLDFPNKKKKRANTIEIQICFSSSQMKSKITQSLSLGLMAQS